MFWVLVSIVASFVITTFVVPFFYKISPLNNEALKERFQRLAANTKIKLKDILVIHFSKETRKVNAFFAGLGNTKRVFLADTLINNFDDQEIEVIFAHELGHCQLNHLLKDLFLTALFSFSAFYVCHLTISKLALFLGHSSFTAISAMPLLFLCLTCFSLVIFPLKNIVSRFFEKEADEYALQETKNLVSFKTAFEKLAKFNKADPNPDKRIALIFYSHPPINERIKFAEDYFSAVKMP